MWPDARKQSKCWLFSGRGENDSVNCTAARPSPPPGQLTLLWPAPPSPGCPASALLLSQVPGRCLVRTRAQTESEVFADLTHQVLKPEDCPVGLMTFLENKRSEYYWVEFITLYSPSLVCVSGVLKEASGKAAKSEPSKERARLQC